MPNNITHKTSTTAGAVPTAVQVAQGELAVNAASGKVYTKKVDNTVVELTDPLVMDGGEQFTPLDISNLALWLDASATGALYQTDAGPVTAVNSPLTIAGCALWLDGADATTMFNATTGGNQISAGGTIARWQDKSGNARHATQATTAQQPTLTAAALNGLSVVTFDGADDGMNITFPSMTNQTIFVVVYSQAGDSSQNFISEGGSGYGITISRGAVTYIETAFANFTVGDGRVRTQVNATAAPVGPTIISVTRATGPALFQNGLLLGAGTSNSPFTLSRIGSYSSTNLRLTGYIAEIVIYDSSLALADRARVEAYLAAKWGLSGVHPPATATSDPVGYWRDKSGNNRHATQAVAANRPTIHSSTQNGRPVLSFDGTNDALLGTGAQSLVAGTTIFGAYFAGAVNYASLFCIGEPSPGKRWLVGSSATKVGLDYYTNALATDTLSQNRTGLTTWLVNRVAAANTPVLPSNAISIRLNGATAVTQSGLNPALASYTPDTYAVGGVQAQNEQFLVGRVFELIVFSRVLTAVECRQVETYLAAKWGVTIAPQVSNIDAQGWINRVYNAGGTVSYGTAAAVNTFCNAIDAAGIRDRFYRLNLLCGSDLTACLVPLYRGPSLSGTQYGNATDTNVNFLAADYVETGSTRGLKGNGTTKRLNTGLAPSTIGISTTHISIYASYQNPTHAFRFLLGTSAASNTRQVTLGQGVNPGSFLYVNGANNGVSIDRAIVPPPKFMLGSVNSSRAAIFVCDQSFAAGTLPEALPLTSNDWAVFDENRGSGGSGGFGSDARMTAYSIGLDVTSTQAETLRLAVVAFQNALGLIA